MKIIFEESREWSWESDTAKQNVSILYKEERQTKQNEQSILSANETDTIAFYKPSLFALTTPKHYSGVLTMTYKECIEKKVTSYDSFPWTCRMEYFGSLFNVGFSNMSDIMFDFWKVCNHYVVPWYNFLSQFSNMQE